MTTGTAWNVTNPLKPWAYFDPDAVRDIAFEWDVWLTSIGSTYASHAITAATGIEVVSSDEDAGIITVRVRKLAGETLVVGDRYAVKCSIVAADGQKDDQTLYLEIIEK